MQTNIPAPPAPPKKRRVWPWVVGAVIVIASINAANQDSGTSTEPVDIPLLEETVIAEDDVQIEAARFAWDTAITQADRDAICDYYNTPPVGTTPELVEIFATNAGLSYAEADQVLNQLLAEEC